MNPYFRTPPVTKNLLIINILVFLATWILPSSASNAIVAFGALQFGYPTFHTYQLVTYMFLHANFSHIFFNMFALWMFGRQIEYDLGPKRFLIYYMVCGVGAALFQWLVAYMTGGLPMGVIGASGAIFGLLLAFGVMHPNITIMLMIPPIPMKAKWFVMIYAVIELFFGVTGGGGNVAHFAHIGGMLFGWLLLYLWKKQGMIRY